jgi:two-component system, cell cycle response regulator DivK
LRTVGVRVLEREETSVPKVLLVEDNEMNRDMLSRRLTRRGFQVLMAVDGEQGVEMAKSERPDLILMDMSLPVLDGWGATRRIRAESETRFIPLIALTAHAMAGDRDKALEAGCDDYDTKPIELPRLLEKINRLLSSARETAPWAADAAPDAAVGAAPAREDRERS